MAIHGIRPFQRCVFVVALLGLAASAQSQVRTGHSSFQVGGRAGHRVVVGNNGLGSSKPSPVPPALSWRLIGRPAGSQAAVDDPTSPQFSFIPDLQGTYLAEGNTGSKPVRLVIAVGPQSVLTPVTLQGNVGGNIIVGGQTYLGPGAAGINVVLLNRADLTYVDQSTGSVADVKTYLDSAIQKHGNTVLFLIASGTSIGGNLSDLAPELEKIGATTAFEGVTTDYPFSFVGLAGLKAGQAYQVGGESLSGNFVPDVNSNYVFSQMDYVPFTTKPSTDVNLPATFQVGGTSIESGPPPNVPYSFSGGFFLAALDADSLQVLFQQTYPTLSDTPEHSIAQQQALLAKLKQYENGAGTLVFLCSFGSAHNGNAPDTTDFARLAQEIDTLGGSYEAVYNINIGDTYSLVFWTDSSNSRLLGKEAGSQIEQESTGVLRGVLQRQRQGNWYRPVSTSTIVSSNGAGDFDLYSILAKPPQPFPVLPQPAYANISKTVVCPICTDLRADYPDLSVDIDALRRDLEAKAAVDPTDLQSASCLSTPLPNTDYCRAFQQLDTELGDVAQVRSLYNALDGIYTASQANVSLKLTAATQRVNDALKPKPPSPAASIVESVIGSVLSIAGAALGPTKYAIQGAALGIVSTLFNFGAGVANSVDGNSSVLNVNTQAGQLAQDAVAAFEQQKVAQGLAFQIILEDGGKTSITAGKILDPNSGFTIDADRVSSLLDALDNATEVSTYQSLLAIDFVIRVWNAQDPANQTPGAYKYEDPDDTSIFRSWNELNYYSSTSPRISKNLFERDFFMLTKAGSINGSGGSNVFDPSYIQLSPESLLQHVFAATSDSGLAVRKSDFYRKWPFQKFYCSAPGNPLQPTRDTPVPSTCDFSTPQLPQ